MNVVPLADAAAGETFGGKASALARAIAGGLKVPDGIAVPWQLVDRYATGDREAAEAIIGGVRRWAAGESSPPGRHPAGSGADHAHDDGLRDNPAGFRVAVRSSAIDEDSVDASFAGQHATILNLTTESAVLRAILTVHASARSTATMDYRRMMSIVGDQTRIAVVVQQMIEPDCAGVLFTRDPLTGNDERVIESTWGLGEAVVSGLVTPDHFRIAASTGQILERHAAHKELAVSLAPNGAEGTIQTALSPQDSARLSLTDTQLLDLERLAVLCESHFGGPQDVEWAFADDSLVLLQSRPITVMAPRVSVPTVSAPTVSAP